MAAGEKGPEEGLQWEDPWKRHCPPLLLCGTARVHALNFSRASLHCVVRNWCQHVHRGGNHGAATHWERGRVLLEGTCTQLTGVAPCSCFLFFLVHTAYALAVPPLSCAGNLVLGSGGLAPWQGTKGQQPGGQQDCMVKGETVGKFKCRTRVAVVAPVMKTSDR